MRIEFREECESILDSICYTTLDIDGPCILKNDNNINSDSDDNNENENNLIIVIYCINKKENINSIHDLYLPFWMKYLYNLNMDNLDKYKIESISNQQSIPILDSISVEWIEICTGPDPFLSKEIHEALKGLIVTNGSIFTAVIRGFRGYIKISEISPSSPSKSLLLYGKITQDTKINPIPRLLFDYEKFKEMPQVLYSFLDLVESFDNGQISIEQDFYSLPSSLIFQSSSIMEKRKIIKKWPWIIGPMPLRLQESAIGFTREHFSSLGKCVFNMDFEWSIQDSNIQDSTIDIFNITRHLQEWLSSLPNGTIIIIEDVGLVGNLANFSRLKQIINRFPKIIFISFCMIIQEFMIQGENSINSKGNENGRGEEGEGELMIIPPNLKVFSSSSIVPQLTSEEYENYKLILNSMSFYDLDNLQFLIDHFERKEFDSKDGKKRKFKRQEAIKEAFNQAQKLENDCLERWPVNNQINWNDIIGHENVVKKLRAMIYGSIEEGELFHQLGLRSVKGILLHGPTGIGKTMIIQALVNDNRINVYRLLISKTLSQYFGQSEANLRSVFDHVQSKSPCILVIEDIEWIGLQRGISDDNTGVGERLLSTLLNELDGINTRNKNCSNNDSNNNGNINQGLMILATTRCREKIDSALLRPGRLDFHLELKYPDRTVNMEIIQKFSREFNVNIEDKDEMETILDLCTNLSPSEIRVQFNRVAIDRKVAIETNIIDLIKDFKKVFKIE